MALAESLGTIPFAPQIRSLSQSVFAVFLGQHRQVKLDVFPGWHVIGAALLITFLAVVGKFFGGKWGTKGESNPIKNLVGMGMVRRGEVGIRCPTWSFDESA